MDRSDGRPDLSLSLVATKFDDFISTCLRTEGAAWTAALGPLDYLGLRLSTFGDNTPEKLVIDIPKLAYTVGTRLLDLPVDVKERSKVLRDTESYKLSTWNLALTVSRLATRYFLLADQLEGTPPPSPQKEIRVLYGGDPEDVTLPPSCILESLVALDLCVAYSTDNSSNCFALEPSSVSMWCEKNKLV